MGGIFQAAMSQLWLQIQAWDEAIWVLLLGGDETFGRRL